MVAASAIVVDTDCISELPLLLDCFEFTLVMLWFVNVEGSLVDHQP